ncbi:probable receptor-like protein kinase [Tanacetum coccineum]
MGKIAHDMEEVQMGIVFECFRKISPKILNNNEAMDIVDQNAVKLLLIRCSCPYEIPNAPLKSRSLGGQPSVKGKHSLSVQERFKVDIRFFRRLEDDTTPFKRLKCAQETIQESRVLALAYKPLRDMTITDCGFGSVHIGIIKSLEHPFDDIRVAVKRGGHKEWEVKVKVDGEIKHQNLVKRIGYYMRLIIAQDAATGLAYLRDGMHSQIIFRDSRPSNILLDSQMNMNLMNFGLARKDENGNMWECKQVILMGTLTMSNMLIEKRLCMLQRQQKSRTASKRSNCDSNDVFKINTLFLSITFTTSRALLRLQSDLHSFLSGVLMEVHLPAIASYHAESPLPDS